MLGGAAVRHRAACTWRGWRRASTAVSTQPTCTNECLRWRGAACARHRHVAHHSAPVRCARAAQCQMVAARQLGRLRSHAVARATRVSHAAVWCACACARLVCACVHACVRRAGSRACACVCHAPRGERAVRCVEHVFKRATSLCHVPGHLCSSVLAPHARPIQEDMRACVRACVRAAVIDAVGLSDITSLKRLLSANIHATEGSGAAQESSVCRRQKLPRSSHKLAQLPVSFLSRRTL